RARASNPGDAAMKHPRVSAGPYGVGVLLLAALPAFTLCPPARAELPPGSYNTLRAEAQEALVIEVSDVRTEERKRGETAVVVEAKVLGVERSASKLKRGDTLQIRYTHHDLSKLDGFAGPRPVPILRKG